MSSSASNLASNDLPKLTGKQQLFVNELMSDKRMTPTEAAVRAYQPKDRKVARVIGSQNLSNPNIVSHLSEYNDLAESVIKSTMQSWGNSRNVRERETALDAAKYAHDKVHGKATQRIEQQSVSVHIDIDLS